MPKIPSVSFTATIYVLFFCGSFLFSNANQAQPMHFMPGEFAEQRAVCVGYDPYFEKEFLAICQALEGKIKVYIIASAEQDKQNMVGLLVKNGIDPTHFEVFCIAYNRIWMRDHGPTFLKDQNDSLLIADFNWNMYGAQFWFEHKYGKDSELALSNFEQLQADSVGKVDQKLGLLFGAPMLSTEVVMEGGSIEVNGKGTLILCEELTLHRNPNLSKTTIESELNALLGTSQTIWLEQGLVEDPHWFQQIHENYYGFGTKGHTDEFVRFANDTTILLAWVDESEKDLNFINQENYRRMSRNLEIIKHYKDHRGKPFHVVKIPIPTMMSSLALVSNLTSLNLSKPYQKIALDQFPEPDRIHLGDTISWVSASSYLNYLITNNVILLPDYSHDPENQKKQEELTSIFRSLFPNKELVFIDVMKLNYFGGGIHCVTQQIPK